MARIAYHLLDQQQQQQQQQENGEQRPGATAATTGSQQERQIQAAFRIVKRAVDTVTRLEAVLEVFEEHAWGLANP